MSFAIIQTGGKQYKVKAGEILKVEKLNNSTTNNKIEFKEILAYGDDKSAEIGSPNISGAKVEADIVKSGKILGQLNFDLADRFNLNKKLILISGTTDSNASVIAAGLGKLLYYNL